MKKLIAIILSVVLVLSLCACTKAETKPEEVEPLLIEAGRETAETTPEDLIAVAESYTDCEVSELIAVIGEPISREYVSSCIGNGDDGELYYDGFIVFTYREGDSEIVMGVE